ncbi:MAG: hypothetical protein HYR55_07905 [Acidobacteria bacterium]|nr:hypothetical protein [Acidobacteriota bacterium]MBI3657865.1 hypothetical protein [Acidobacteriota bacterium]
MNKTIAGFLLAILALTVSACNGAHLFDKRPERIVALKRSKPVEQEKSLAAYISYGVGQMTVSPAGRDVLYSVDLEYDANRETPSLRYAVTGSAGRLDLTMDSDRSYNYSANSRLDLEITEGLPIDLRLQTGVSEAKIDLSGIQLQRLEVEGGVGQTTLSFTKINPRACDQISLRSGIGEFKVVGLGNADVGHLLYEGGIGSAHLDLTGTWRRDTVIEMRLGVGEVNLIAPQELGIEIEGHKGFLSSLHLSGFDKLAGGYRSRNYDKSKYHLLVRVKTGIGAVRVRWA